MTGITLTPGLGSGRCEVQVPPGELRGRHGPADADVGFDPLLRSVRRTSRGEDHKSAPAI
jgi:hypothetical protein